METEHHDVTEMYSEKFGKYKLTIYLDEHYYQKVGPLGGFMKNQIESMSVSATFKNKPLHDFNKLYIKKQINTKTYMLKFEDHEILVSKKFIYYLDMF